MLRGRAERQRNHSFVELAGVVGIAGDGVLPEGDFPGAQTDHVEIQGRGELQGDLVQGSGGGVAQGYACLGFHRLLARGEMHIEVPRGDDDRGSIGVSDGGGVVRSGRGRGLRLAGEDDLRLGLRGWLFGLLGESEEAQATSRDENPKLHEPRPFCRFGGVMLAASGAGRRCRAASNRTTAPAAETFSDSTFPAIGMRSR